MKLLLPFTILASLVLAQARWVPSPGVSWNYFIGVNDENVILNRKEDVLTIDLNRRNLVPKLHSQGKRVVCYFSGGTIEPHRKDKDDYYAIPNLIIGDYTAWNEQWLDIRMRKQLEPLIRRRMKQAYDAGCDAVEVDCLGAHNHEPAKLGITKDDSFVFAQWVADAAHDIGISIGLKNLATLAPKLINKFDFAVVESCSRSVNVCALYKDFPKQGKAVFTIHYGDFGSFSNQVSTLVKEQKGLGYSCIFNDDIHIKTPSFAYNCDTGSKSNTSGDIPKQETSSVKKTTIKKTTTTKNIAKTTIPNTVRTTTTIRKTSRVVSTIRRTTTTQIKKVTTVTTKTIPTHTVSQVKTTTKSSVKTTNLPSKPVDTNPPVSNPPVSNPPVSNPPISSKPISNPPVSNPPVSSKPISNPPVSNPPVSSKPISNPPVSNPPVSNDQAPSNPVNPINPETNNNADPVNTVNYNTVPFAGSTVAFVPPTTTTFGPINTATATLFTTNTPVISKLPTQNVPGNNNREIEGVDKDNGSSTGTTIGIVAATGSIAAAFVCAFAFLRKTDKYTDIKRSLSRKLTRKSKGTNAYNY